jgi:putative ABC transport system ATP-binding protein
VTSQARVGTSVDLDTDVSAGQRLRADGVAFQFPGPVTVLDDVDLTLGAGERVALMGQSGSGKSTLLHLLSGVLRPTRGKVTFQGSGLSDLGRDDRARVRLEKFGFVFQFAELLPDLTLRENVQLPVWLLGGGPEGEQDAFERADSLLDRMGVSHVRDRLPSQVSGGERQRAAISRALVHRPDVVFADEPTGALDEASGGSVMSALLALAAADGASVLVVTHNPSVASMMDRTVLIRDGRIVA